MTYGNATVETREILAPMGEGVIVDDPDFPVEELATIGVIIEGALDEEFDVLLFVAREAVQRIYAFLAHRYRNLSIQVDAYCGSEDDRTQILSLSTETDAARQIERDRDRIITKMHGAD